MREGDITIAAGALNQALKSLQARWDETEPHWRDVVRVRYGREHIEPIMPQVEQTLKAIHRLAMILNQAREECA